MRLARVCALAAAALLAGQEPAAEACSCGSPRVMPQDGATGVARNAVVLVVPGGADIEMIEAATGAAVPFDVEAVMPSRDNPVTVVRPRDLLAAGVEYEVRLDGALLSSFIADAGIDETSPEFSGVR